MSDNELDAELLGMVGGESDDEGEEVDQTQHIEDRSPSQEAKPSVEKAEEPAKRTKGIAQKVRGRRKKARKQESEDEDDLGGSPSADSLGSGAMDESDGEADAHGSPEGEDAPLFPLEGKYTSAQDRSDILAMPEIQREEILADRAAQVLKKQQDQQLRKALAAASNAASKHKRKAAAADLEDGGKGRSTRPKAEKPARSALDDYKRARELKGTDRGSRLDSGRDRRHSRSRSHSSRGRGSDRDADGESEVEWAEPSSESNLRNNGGREEHPATLKDFERCRVGRSNFAKICFYPGFEEAIKGCFARVSIGMNRETGQNMYRMTQIKGFTEGKAYQMESSNGKHFVTDQYALVAHGVAEKPWPFSACSDSRFTEAEFERYTETMRKENQRPPKMIYLEARLQGIHKLLNMEWTDELLSKKFANQRAMERKHDPANAARLKRENILKRKLDAQETGDAEEVMRCDAELAALENRTASHHNHHSNGSRGSPSAKKDFATAGSAGSVPAVQMRQQDRLAALNQKNRGKNAEEVRKALLEEKRKLQAFRDQAIAEAKTKAAKEKAEKEVEEAKLLLAVPRGEMSDLFGEGSDISRAGTPMSGVGRSPRRSRAGTPMNGGGGVKKERSKLGGVGKKKDLDDEVIGGLDLGIDVEI